ncbi:MAG: acyl-CoA dehydrogenase, partial [Pseudomonas sp.]|nr:acyl-CoA dehydrogenase [Pseudomonas sp.]
HLLLAALFAQFAALRPEVDAAMAAGPPAWAQLWQRDQNLLNIAASARAKRLEKALLTLGMTDQ